MAYSVRMQKNHYYSTFFAPRGAARMYDQGMQIAQQYLSPFDKIVGIVGEAGSGKSILIKGMFPGLELTNDDEGVNVRPLPLLHIDDTGFYSAHTYHLDIRFESAFLQMHELATAILGAVEKGKRVIVEHFDLIYPFLGCNAHLLIGVGEEIIVTRPNLFGPEPNDIRDIVFKSIKYRRMTHSAEDLCEFILKKQYTARYQHADVRHGFILSFEERPTFDLQKVEDQVKALIEEDLDICYADDNHISIGEHLHVCTGPRMHVHSTSEVEHFTLLKEFLTEPITNRSLMVGLVGKGSAKKIGDLNKLHFEDD